MELYKTVARDRVERGKEELKLICLANAVNVFNYTFDVLEVTDVVAEMSVKHQECLYMEDRGIFIRLLKTDEDMIKVEQKTGIYRAMSGTAWGRMAFGNEFAYNDFSCVAYRKIKGYVPIVSLNDMTIYHKKGSFEIYISYTPAKCPTLDGTKDNERLLFKRKYSQRIYNAFVNGNITFESYEIKARILEIIL